MKKLFSKIKDMLGGSEQEYEDVEGEEKKDEYLEIDTASPSDGKKKVIVKTYFLQDFEDVKPILDDLREGMTIALINIKPLKDKDIIELKRAINKIKKTTDAIQGEVAGFGEDYIVVTPSFAKIYRSKPANPGAAKQPADG